MGACEHGLDRRLVDCLQCEKKAQELETLKAMRIKGLRVCCDAETTMHGNADHYRYRATFGQKAALDSWAAATQAKLAAKISEVKQATTYAEVDKIVW